MIEIDTFVWFVVIGVVLASGPVCETSEMRGYSAFQKGIFYISSGLGQLEGLSLAAMAFRLQRSWPIIVGVCGCLRLFRGVLMTLFLPETWSSQFVAAVLFLSLATYAHAARYLAFRHVHRKACFFSQ